MRAIRFVLGRRIHHGFVGLALAVLGYFPRKLWLRLSAAVIGIALMIDDAEDFPWYPERNR